jgi:anti-sigma B factor antagonist
MFIEQIAVKMEQSGNVTIITLPQTRDRDVANVIARDLLCWTDSHAGVHLLLDFTHVDYLSSVELGTLITLHKDLQASGGRLTLFNLVPQVYQVFSVTRLDTYLDICREQPPLAPEDEASVG